MSGNPGDDVPFVQGTPTTREIVPLVEICLPWSASRSSRTTADGWNRVDGQFHHSGIMNVRSRDCRCERYVLLINYEVVLRPGFSAIRGVGAGGFAPFFSGMDEPSSATRSHLTSSWRLRSASMACQIRSQTPGRCQATKRRQQVVPELYPYARGNSSHGIA